MTTAVIPRDLADRAAELIAKADSLIIAAGAGMGVDSGLPDFRGGAGFWRAYPALAAAGLRFEQIAAPATFVRDPALAWGFYGHRLKLYRETTPHAGFNILRRWSEALPHGAFVFTSNVDGQFQKAGFSAEHIRECHGSIHVLQCAALCGQGDWLASNLEPVIDEAACRWIGSLPTCARCGGIARPNVLMFNDSRWFERRYAMQRERLDNWLQTVTRPVVVELGAGTSIASVRDFSEWITKSRGGRLIRINPRESRVPSALDVSAPAGALETLNSIDRVLDRRRGLDQDRL